MSYDVRLPAGRGLLWPVLEAVWPARLPLWDMTAGEWVLRYGAAWQAVAALRVMTFELRGPYDR